MNTKIFHPLLLLICWVGNSLTQAQVFEELDSVTDTEFIISSSFSPKITTKNYFKNDLLQRMTYLSNETEETIVDFTFIDSKLKKVTFLGRYSYQFIEKEKDNNHRRNYKTVVLYDNQADSVLNPKAKYWPIEFKDTNSSESLYLREHNLNIYYYSRTFMIMTGDRKSLHSCYFNEENTIGSIWNIFSENYVYPGRSYSMITDSSGYRINFKNDGSVDNIYAADGFEKNFNFYLDEFKNREFEPVLTSNKLTEIYKPEFRSYDTIKNDLGDGFSVHYLFHKFKAYGITVRDSLRKDIVQVKLDEKNKIREIYLCQDSILIPFEDGYCKRYVVQKSKESYRVIDLVKLLGTKKIPV